MGLSMWASMDSAGVGSAPLLIITSISHSVSGAKISISSGAEGGTPFDSVAMVHPA